MKSIEMTVRRALTLIAAFDEIVQKDKSADWTDLDLKTWRATFGSVIFTGQELPELWKRYKSGTLHQQVLDLAANLNMEDLVANARREIQDGLDRISTK